MTDLKKVLGGINPADDGAVLRAAEATEAAAAEVAVTDATDLLAAQMAARGRQANLSFFAFTATPKPERWSCSANSSKCRGGRCTGRSTCTR